MRVRRSFRGSFPGLLRLVTNIACCAFGLWISLTAQALQAGAGRAEIAIEPGIPLDGVVERMGRPSESIAEPLSVRCLYLEGDTEAMFWVALDIYAIREPVRERILDFVPETDLPVRVIVSATGNMRGPGGTAIDWLGKREAGRFTPEVLDALGQAAGEAMYQAHESRRRATAGFASAPTTGAWPAPAEGESPYTADLSVLRIDDSDGAPIGIVATIPGTERAPSPRDGFIMMPSLRARAATAVEARFPAPMVMLPLTGGGAARNWNDAEAVDPILSALSDASFAAIQRVRGVETDIALTEYPIDLPPGSGAGFLPESISVLALQIAGGQAVSAPFALDSAVHAECRSELENAPLLAGLSNGYWGRLPDRAALANAANGGHALYVDPDAMDFVQQALRGESEDMTSVPAAIPHKEADGWATVAAIGSPYQRGFARGQAHRSAIHAQFVSVVTDAIHEGRIQTTDPFWSRAPKTIDGYRVLLPELAAKVRARLGGVAPETVDEILGIARGSDLPFDAIWLLHAIEPDAGAAQSFFAAWPGDEDSGPLLLVGIPADEPDALAVTEQRPAEGHAWLQFGEPWRVGARLGLNDAGVTVWAGAHSNDEVYLAIADALRVENRLDDAVARLRAAKIAGVYVADRPGGALAVVEAGPILEEVSDDETDPPPFSSVIEMTGNAGDISDLLTSIMSEYSARPDAARLFRDIEDRWFEFETRDTQTPWVLIAVEPRNYSMRIHLLTLQGLGDSITVQIGSPE